MKIAVRLDDITPDMDWEKFERTERLLYQYDVRPLIGVVPDNQDSKLQIDEEHPDFTGKLAEWQQRGWIIAMHGVKHLYTTDRGGLFPLNHFSEFAGKSLEEQRRQIREGKEALRAKWKLETDIFMAPGHSYDKNTLTALRENGFRYITDGFGAVPYRWQGLIFLPIAFLKSRELKRKHGCTTVVLHTNTMDEADFADLEAMLKNYAADMISYEEYLQIPPVDRKLFGRIKEYVLANLKHLLVTLRS